MVVLAVLQVVLFTIASVTTVQGSGENNTYIIVAPKVFRPGMDMVLRVSILKSTSPVDVKASIRNEITKLEVATARGTYEAGKSGNLGIKIPFGNVVKQASYELSVNGTGGLQFSEKSYIQFREKGFSIYIQTDKGIYKPGQTVHMRILAVYPDLKPYTGKMTVNMLDPNSNKMQHWADLKGPAGVIEKDFTLSSDPVYGNWKISVLAEIAGTRSANPVMFDGHIVLGSLNKARYFLPRFKVSVELPPFVIDGAKELKGKVISKYTYGKGVKGTATVRAFFSVWNPSKKMEVTKSIEVPDGSGYFSFSMEHINKIFKSSWSWYNTVFDASWVKLTVNATVEEELTGKKASAENQVSFYKTDVKLSFPKINPGTFKPGLKYVGVLAVTKPDDTPLPPDRLRNLKIYVKTDFMYRSKGTTEEYTPSTEGLVTLTKEVPQNAETIRFQASLDESLKDHVYHSAQKAISPSSSYIQLSTPSSSYEAEEDVECKLRATFVLVNAKLTYMVMSRGNIVLNKVETLSTSTKEASFKFKAIHSMAPSARLVVYIIQKDGEVVVDSLNLRVDKPFENEVSVSYSRNESRPGDQVVLKTKATPGSYVGILAVDESVLLMKKDNDFSHKKVIEELQSYDSAHQIFPWFFDWGPRRRRRMVMPFPTSGQDAASVFENSGIVVLSNCNVYREAHPWTAYGDGVGRPVLFAFAESDNTLLRAKSGGAGGQPKLKEVTRVRTLFPETWIWRNATADSDGEADLVVPVPDTITSWVASAFALHSTAGFGVGPLKPKLKVFQPFFVSLDLPYSVIRGEQVAIRVLVFNYLDEAMKVKVTLKKSANWHVIDELSNGVEDGKEISPDIERMVTVPAGAGEAVSFPIIPKVLGNIPVVVQAQSTEASDAVRRNLLVEPEGIPQEYSYSLLIDLNSTNKMSRELELALPPSAVEGSAKAKVTIIGDILGSSISNLDDLLRMPYGCGEQNMVNFAPNIFVMKYLSTVKQLTAYIKNKAENYMRSGYQREQTYRHKEGSYSAFGERDALGSLWLTAFVAKSFAQARDYIYIDPDSLQLSLNWIVRQQKSDGSFPRVGKVHSSGLKGGLKGEVALTAYVLITLVESKSSDKKVTDAIKKALSYVERTIEKEDDPYTLAIVYYALTLENSAARHAVKQKLLALAKRQDGTVHWAEKKETAKKSWRSPYYKPPSADIEITAYVLLALASDKDMKLGLEVVRWLSQQRNSLGGYGSTQDTVVGIQALAEFASLMYSPKVNFNVNIGTKQLDRTVTVDNNNAMVLQVIDLPKVEGMLKVDATGHGFGMLQVGVTYHVNSTLEKTSFDFRFQIVKDELDVLETEACAKWTGESDASDMTVMEVGIISGFSLDSEQARKLLSNKELSLKRVDTRGRKVMLYFDEIRKSSETCVKLKFERSYAVGKAQPVPAVLYDYYHPEKRSSALYMSEKLASEGVCRVCPDCVNCRKKTGPSARPRSSHPVLRGSWLTPVLALVITIMAAAQWLE